jgi:hypothetical protein
MNATNSRNLTNAVAQLAWAIESLGSARATNPTHHGGIVALLRAKEHIEEALQIVKALHLTLLSQPPPNLL